MVIKGILDAGNAHDAVRLGADGIVASNQGGRQLDSVLSSARARLRMWMRSKIISPFWPTVAFVIG